MKFLLHGTTLTFAWFLAINAVLSALVVWIARRELRSHSPAFWFGLRLFPAAASATFAAVVFVPSYWRYEPRESGEGFDITLTACALAAAVMLAAAGARAARAWWRASCRTRVWMQTSRPIALGCGLPAFAVDAEAPIMALVGVIRPRLLVTRGLLNALTDEELAASVAHELGHSRARDNFKRLAMRAAPDLLGASTAARAIERRWASAAEHDADRMAGDATPAARCALASALVKVARLTPPEPLSAEPISTLVGGGHIASRVHDLLTDRVPPSRQPRRSRAWLVAAILLAATAAYGPLIHAVHDATEIVVHLVP